MKSGVKILICGAVGLFLGITASRCDGLPGVKLVNTVTWKVSAVKQLSLQYYSEKVTIIESDSDKIILEEYQSKPKGKYKAKVTEQDQKVDVKATEQPALGLYHGYTKLYLPKDYNGVLSVKTESGEIWEEEAISYARFEAASQSGAMKLSDISAEEISLTSHSGEISLEGAQGSLEVNTASGGMAITGFSGSADLNSSSGKISAVCTDELEELSAVTGSGSVTVTVPPKFPFCFYAGTKSGGVRTFFKDKLEEKDGQYQAVIGDDPHCVLEVSTSSGSITIKEK